MRCVTVSLVCAVLVSACSYDSVRLNERQKCGAMPQTEATRCYSRTQDTKAEYDAKRKKVKEAAEKPGNQPADPRYEQWIP
jgi:hypothetical protein